MTSQYAPRVVDSFLDDFQPHLRTLALQGPKAAGKTVTASQRVDAVVVTTGSHAYRRSDGVGVVPAALLGP